MKKASLLFAMFFLYLSLIQAQPGALDSSFGNNGIVIDDLGQPIINSSTGRQALVQSDGSIYILFQTKDYAFIAKRNSNGVPDKSYGKNSFSQGVYMLPAKAVLLQDGKIVVAGSYYSDFALFRLNTNGSLDSTFGTNGIQLTDFASGNDYAADIAIQTDGKIVVIGTHYQDTTSFVIARYTTNGNLDSSFSEDGVQFIGFGISSVAIQNDGKIVAAGSTVAFKGNDVYSYANIARFNANGTFDSTFSKDGKQTTRSFDSNGKPLDFMANAVTIQPDGKIVITGNGIARYNTDGSLDKTFSGDGKLTAAFGSLPGSAQAIAIQSDGKIVIAGIANTGNNTDFALARYNTNGSLDHSFSDDGIQTTDFTEDYDFLYSLVIQPDGKILVGGEDGECESYNCINKFAVARYNLDGGLDNTFDEDGKLTGGYFDGNITYKKIAVQQDGKLVVIGSLLNSSVSEYYNNNSIITRYNTNGTLDKTFSEDGIETSDFDITSVAIQNDGKIVVAGTATNPKKGDSAVIARYNTDGRLDSTFSGDGRQTDEYNEADYIAIQNDGKIVVASTPLVNSDGDYSFAFGLVRYNIDGSLDSSFSNDGKQKTLFHYENIRASSVAIQRDGKIVVAGTISSLRTTAIAIARYNIDGSLDNMRTTNYDDNEDFASSMAIQNDDKIVVAGSRIFRFNTDLSLDKSFSEDGITPNGGSSISIQTDNKILVGGIKSNNFAITRYNIDGNFDSTFSKDGIQITKVADNGVSNINGITIHENKLYAAGTLTNYGSLGSYGVIGRYLLNEQANTPPTVTLTIPTNNTTRLAPAAHIKLSAVAVDKDGSISKVEFYNGTHLLHTETVIPYGFVWRNVGLGNYTLTAKAYDNDGLVTTSAPVHISVVPNKPPFVSIINPKNNETFAASANIQIEADAKDLDGRMTRVEFYNGSTLLNTQYQLPYRFVWKDVPAGTYTITAVARDNWSARTTSAPVTFTVRSKTSIVSSRALIDPMGKVDAASITLSPNPANTIVNIYTTGLQQDKPATIRILSASGVVMKTMQINSSAKTIQLDVFSLIRGVYTIQLLNDNKLLYKQFVKL